MGNPIGSIKVQVNNESLRVQNSSGTVNVQQGNQKSPRVQTISYGQKLELKNATDLNMANVANGDVIIYEANTNSFVVEPLIINSSEIPNIEGGTF